MESDQTFLQLGALSPCARNGVTKADAITLLVVKLAEKAGQGWPSMRSNTILVVDDEPRVRRLLQRSLESDGFTVVEADTEVSVLDALRTHDVDLVTLDLQLGNESGLEIAKSVARLSDVPIIMITSKGDVIDRVVGLELGAHDYITKPFNLREVTARVRSVLRRTQHADGNGVVVAEKLPPTTKNGTIISFDGLTAKLDQFEVIGRDAKMLDLTSGDFRLLAVFLQNPKRVLSRDRLMDLLNGADWAPLDRTIDNQVARLRKKIERNPTSPALIKTVRGIGYTFATDVS